MQNTLYWQNYQSNRIAHQQKETSIFSFKIKQHVVSIKNHFKIHFILCSYKCYHYVIKKNTFGGDLTNTSAKTKTMEVMIAHYLQKPTLNTGKETSSDNRNAPNYLINKAKKMSDGKSPARIGRTSDTWIIQNKGFPSSSWSCQCPCGCGTVVKRYSII